MLYIIDICRDSQVIIVYVCVFYKTMFPFIFQVLHLRLSLDGIRWAFL